MDSTSETFATFVTLVQKEPSDATHTPSETTSTPCASDSPSSTSHSDPVLTPHKEPSDATHTPSETTSTPCASDSPSSTTHSDPEGIQLQRGLSTHFITGLSNKSPWGSLNGQHCTLQRWDEDKSCWHVQLRDGTTKRLKPESLEPATGDAQREAPAVPKTLSGTSPNGRPAAAEMHSPEVIDRMSFSEQIELALRISQSGGDGVCQVPARTKAHVDPYLFGSRA
jgi:hypothetical protein